MPGIGNEDFEFEDTPSEKAPDAGAENSAAEETVGDSAPDAEAGDFASQETANDNAPDPGEEDDDILFEESLKALRETTEEMRPTETLLEACQKGNLDKVKAALDNGADITAADDNGDTALHLAVLSGNPEVVQYLVVKEISVDAENKRGMTALNYAVHNARAIIVTILGQAGADVNHRNAKTRETPLMLASYRGDNEVVTRLLRFKPDLDAQDVNGVTATMRAAGQNNKESLKFVMEAGADPYVTSKTGRRARDFAATAKAQECLDYLHEFMPQYEARTATEGAAKSFTPLKKIAFRRMDTPHG